MKMRYLLLCAVGLLLLVPVSSSAAPIDPGYDYLTTPLDTATLDLTLMGLGVIDLESRGIQGTTTDTIVQRMGGLPDGGTGPIPVEIVALSLQSVSPVTIGTSFFDVFVEIDAGGLWGLDPAPNPTPPSTGTLTVTSHVGDGGTFDSFFDVFADIVFVEQGNPGNNFHQGAFPPPVHITSTGSTWTHSGATDPSMGGFRPGPITHTGPHPQTDPAQGPFPVPIPEPSTLVLGLIATLGVGLMAIRKRRMPRVG